MNVIYFILLQGMELGEADAQAFRRTLAESKQQGTIDFLTQGLINRKSSYVQVCEINGNYYHW